MTRQTPKALKVLIRAVTWKIAVSKEEMLLKVTKFKYSPFFEGSILVTSHKTFTNIMYVTLHLRNQDWARSLISPSTKSLLICFIRLLIFLDMTIQNTTTQIIFIT